MSAPSPGTEGPSTLVELLRGRATREPDRRGYTFLKDGTVEEAHMTWAELDLKARALGAWLQRSMAPGDRALLLYPPGLEFIAGFLGCLYAGVVAVPGFPPGRNISRVRSMASDCAPKVALLSSDVLAKVRGQVEAEPAFEGVSCLATDALGADGAADWKDPGVGRDSLAYLQYTSGSTATPKGVMVSHGNLVHNSRDMDLGWEHGEDSVIVTWLPTFHDMGLIYGVLQPIYKGIPCVMMAPASFIQRPIRWLQAMTRYKGTHGVAPNFGYEHCVRRTKPEDRVGLDLSRWQAAVSGAEPIRKETLERFSEAFEPHGFRWRAFCPGYGLAEATLKVTAVRSADAPVFCSMEAAALERHRVVPAPDGAPGARTLVACGRPALDTRVVIVRPDTPTRCASDEVGEIWIGGTSVAQGYWNRAAETEYIFRARLADTGEGPFLRTGDLGFLRDGELYVTGRLKDLIIVRGQNHYPQDIEETAGGSHPALRPGGGAAFSVEAAGEERVVVVHEVERRHPGLDLEEVKGAVRQAVAEQHELMVHDVVLLRTGRVPKTSSGKVQRGACRTAYLAGSLEARGEAGAEGAAD